MTISPIRDRTGDMIGASTIARDVTDGKRAEAALRASELRLNDLITALPAAIYTTDAQGRITFYNQAAADLAGREPKIGSDQWCASWKLYWPDGRPMRHDECPMAVTLKENRPVRGSEAIAERPDGTRVPFIPYPTPLRDAAGKLVGGVNMLIDITERKRAEQRQQLLIDELNHRVKNTLATVQSIAAQSLKGSSDMEGRQAFEKRLVALSRTHNLLSHDNWESVSLRDLLLQELEPYRSDAGARFSIEGPDLIVKPKAALVLGMAFHELATNAAKYGALSKPEGRVRAAWEVVRASEPSALRLTWTETGGPPVKKRERKGFGSTVIERGLSYELGGKVRLDFDPDGVVFTMEIPFPAGGIDNGRH
jgi:PAS domain S-box-containing protein